MWFPHPDTRPESRVLPTPLAFDTPVRVGGFPSEYRHPVWHGNTRMAWLPDGEKNFEDTFIHFDATHERDRQTDGQTLRDGIGRAYA